MVMESSRGLFEKSRELGMKKPRLEEGSTNEMSNADVRELVIQYKIALAELTFNSKPIITNLTIIAGENLQAAKAIAATICSNIIEVPTDQKLPSLYLLDSIVKNIGRDYIKCFAARLPEVFCKAYRQVDPAVHSGMRHLFETWKGVFPLQCLQMIEKELGFPPSMNGSALRPTTYKPDLQPQRPAHSIHVNPKYVEARQRLQKPSRNMQQPIGNAITDPVQGKNTAHSEYQNGTELSRQPGSGILKTSDGALHQGYESPWYGAGSGDTEARSGQRNNCNTKAMLLSSSSPRPANDDAKSHPIHSIISSRNSSGMESWHSSEEEYMLDDLNSRSNIHNATRKSKRDPLLTDDSERLDFHTSLQSQNLHEFESMFGREASDDSLPLEQTEQEAFGSCSTSIWPRESHAVDGMSYYSSGRMMSGHSEDHYTSTSGLSANANALVRKPLPSPTIIGYSTNEMPRSSGSVRSRQCTRPMASLSGQSSMHQRPPSPSLSIPHYGNQGHNISEQELSRAQTLPHMDIRRSQVPEQLNLGLHRQFAFNPGTPIQNVHPGNSHKLQSHNLQALCSVKPSFKQGHHIPLMQQCQPVHGAYDTSAASIMEKTSPDCFDTPFSENPRQLSTPSLLAPVTESKILGTSSHSGSTRLSFQAPDELPSHSSVQPPLPSSGPPPIQSEAKIASEFHVNSSYKITSLSSILPQAQAEQSPLPSGPPPASLVCGTSEQSKTTIKATPDPVSSLLSTLVAKGLISAPKTGLSASGPPQIISKPHNSLSQGTAVAPLVTTSYLKVSSTVPPLSSSEELSRSVFVHPLTTSFHRVSSAVVSSCSSEVLSLSDLDTKSCIIVPVTSLEEKKDLIGLEFKPNVIRELHPLVISDLLDNLSYHCSICDMRMKIIEQFDRHMEWHAAKNLKSESSNKTARGWYVSSNKWIAKKVSKHETEDISDVPGIAFGNNNEQMVPADENQCACVLCGELFEDIYNTKEDQWMFKGVVYLNLSSNDDVENTGDVASHGPIIHVDCISESSTHDLGLTSL